MKNIKRILHVALVTMLCTAPVSTAFANSRVVTVQIGSSTATINGASTPLEVPPYISNSNTMLPLRFVANALNISDSNIVFEPHSKSISITQPDSGKEIVFQVNSNQIITKTSSGSTSATMGNSAIAEITDSRTFVPLRELATAFDLEIGWEPHTKTVTLTSGGSPLINGQYSLDFIVSEYTKIIEKYSNAFQFNYDATLLKANNLNPLITNYNASQIGYSFIDINGNGVNELIIGTVGSGGSFMELYQIGSGGAELVIRNEANDLFKLCKDGLISHLDSATSGQFTFELKDGNILPVVDGRAKNYYALTDECSINYVPISQLTN